jgi:hypothetical protein
MQEFIEYNKGKINRCQQKNEEQLFLYIYPLSKGNDLAIATLSNPNNVNKRIMLIIQIISFFFIIDALV